MLWAHALRTLSREEQAGTLLAARANQLLLSISLWLRRSIGIDVVPCADVVVSAGTEDEHGVPTPAPYAEWSEKEMERGLTRSWAQSLRPDDECQYDKPTLEPIGTPRRTGLRAVGGAAGGAPRARPARGAPRERPAEDRPQRAAQPVQRFVAGAANGIVGAAAGQVAYHVLNPAPAAGWGRARINRRTGAGFFCFRFVFSGRPVAAGGAGRGSKGQAPPFGESYAYGQPR